MKGRREEAGGKEEEGGGGHQKFPELNLVRGKTFPQVWAGKFTGNVVQEI